MGYLNHRSKENNAMAKIGAAAIVWVGLLMIPQVNLGQSKTADKQVGDNTEAEKRTENSENQKAGNSEPSEETDKTNLSETASPEKSATDPGAESHAVQPIGGSSEKAASTYTVRLRDLEDRINRLKEQIFRSKARLSLLAETVLDRKIAGSQALITFRNEMGGSFKLVKAIFLLDGGPIFNQKDEGGTLADRDVIDLFNGPVMPGEHTLSIVLQYRGHGYGIFSYLKGYQFKTKSSRTFSVNEGKLIKVEVVGYEKGGATTPLEERPDVRYIINVADYEGAPLSGDEKKKKE